MPVLIAHTTRAAGTVLTANIYNEDHQRHVANGQILNDAIEQLGYLSGIQINAIGEFADRTIYDGEAEGFIFLSSDGDGGAITESVIFRKDSAASADWSDAAPLGQGNVSSLDVSTISKVTQAAYNALTPDADTLYLIVG